MGYAVQDLRDLLVLARILRRCAQEQAHDADCGLFLETAAALEARAFSIALGGGLAETRSGQTVNTKRHAPVNLVV
jgi:hypothetical protein